MGAEPRFALVSLVIPPATDPAWLDDLYRGLRAEADVYGVSIVGGNVAATEGPLVVDITLLGSVAPGRAVARTGARPRDLLCVTGTLGAAAAGLLTLLEPHPQPDAALASAVRAARAAQVTPIPRVREGRALAALGAATAMLDISDGLAADLSHLCARSQVGAIVEAAALPITPQTSAVAHAYGRDPMSLALFGGEDYELLFTVRPEATNEALAAVGAAGGSASAIGWITPAEHGMRLRQPDGTESPLAPRGWDHLRAAPG